VSQRIDAQRQVIIFVRHIIEYQTAGSDAISFDATPEVGTARRGVSEPPEVEFYGSVIQHRVRDFSTEERLTQTRRTLTTLVLSLTT